MTYPATRLHRTLDMAADAQGNVTPSRSRHREPFPAQTCSSTAQAVGFRLTGRRPQPRIPASGSYPQYGCEGKDFTGQDLSGIRLPGEFGVRSKLSGAKMGRFVDSHFEGTTAVGTDFSAGRQLVCGKLSWRIFNEPSSTG